jgi:hypothetical protein
LNDHRILTYLCARYDARPFGFFFFFFFFFGRDNSIFLENAHSSLIAPATSGRFHSGIRVYFYGFAESAA